MRINRGHFTRNDPNYIKAKFGKTEAKTKRGWIKIANGIVYHAATRSEVRSLAAAK